MQRVGGREPLRGELGRFYDAIESPRRSAASCRSCAATSFGPIWTRCASGPSRSSTSGARPTRDPLLADGFVYEMLLAHEHQHNETMLQLLQMVEGYEPVERRLRPADRAVTDGPEMVEVEGGDHEIGAGPAGFAYDNERPRHQVELEPFEIDRTPVTNAAYIEFLADTGGEPPMYWELDGEGGWVDHDGAAPSRSTRPPGDPRLLARSRRLRPLGGQAPADRDRVGGGGAGADRERANLDQLGFGCAPAGAYGDAPSDCGAVQMLGDVWEWTALRLHRPIPASRPSRTPSTPRSSSATTTRCCAAAPGRRGAT